MVIVIDIGRIIIVNSIPSTSNFQITNLTIIDTYQTVKEEASIHLVGMKIMIFWSALPDLNRSPVPDEAFVLLRELSRQCLEEIRRGRTATTRQLLSMLAEVRG